MRTPRPITLPIVLLLIALPVFAGDGRWTPLGPPRVGPFLDLIVDPVKPGTLYAVSFGELASGLWKSTDFGEGWFSINQGIPNSYTWSLDLDPFDPETLYALGSLDDRQVLYRSADGGAKWSRVYERRSAAGPYFDEIVPDPSVRGRLFARQHTRVFRSDDGGAAWGFVGWTAEPGKMDACVHIGLAEGDVCADLVADPADPRSLYALSLGGRLYSSLDGGVSWAAIHEGAPKAAQGRPLRADFKTGNLYLLGETGIYRSTDGGATWQTANRGFTTAALSVLHSTPGRKPAVFAAPRGERLLRTRNGGRAWTDAGIGPVTALTHDPSAPARLLAAPAQDPETSPAVYESRNQGETWSPLGALPVQDVVTRLAVHPAQGKVIYAGTRYSGIYKSVNGGATWRRASRGLPFLPACGEVFCPQEAVTALEIDPRDPRTVYAVFGYQVVKSVDAGRTWDRVMDGLEDVSAVEALVLDPENPHAIYIGTREGIFKSFDGGATWRESGFGLPGPSEEFAVLDLAIDARGEQTALYAATRSDGVFRSTDRGATWEPLHEGLPILLVDFVEIDGRRPGGVLAGTAGAGVWSIRFD